MSFLLNETIDIYTPTNASDNSLTGLQGKKTYVFIQATKGRIDHNTMRVGSADGGYYDKSSMTAYLAPGALVSDTSVLVRSSVAHGGSYRVVDILPVTDRRGTLRHLEVQLEAARDFDV